MKTDWQEKRLRQLFRELGREDEREAPSFARLLKSALQRDGRTNRKLSPWGLGAVAATLVLGVAVALVLRAHLSEPAPLGDFSTLQTIPYLETSPVIPLPGIGQGEPEPFRSALSRTQPRHRRAVSPSYKSSILISQWKSPTEVLLRTPGNELLKSLPRVPDPLPGIARGLIQNHN